ncbi:DUF4058 family protein [Neolewinella antarctica]|uniref:DUF4058 family protein n=1 Tax=Neolewinella antarctica TaxID=442734 RepID=A0ABX0XEC9_9BACT|nr:DUF4058 family protein [Neolewinella antarctica]NJC27562.1 hypothetical protein [Neolewinella antarctica]
MKSPFPGMDPFIESYKWSTFHVNAITQIQRQLIEQLPERYLIEVEEGVNANDIILGTHNRYRPDASIIEQDRLSASTTIYPSAKSVTPPTIFVEMDDIKQRTLTIRDSYSRELVTAIEVLSPSNKKGGGLDDYRFKRAEFVRNTINLVELDLLRGGEPPYRKSDWPKRPYCIHTVRAIERTISVWSVGLEERLPRVSVPLLPEDRDLVLDLQTMFDEIYRFSSYPRSITYAVDQLKPNPTAAEVEIIEKIIDAIK